MAIGAVRVHLVVLTALALAMGAGCSERPPPATGPLARVLDLSIDGPNPSTPFGSFVRAGERIFFNAGTYAEGSELWVTDGTAAGTQLVRDLSPGRPSAYPAALTALGSSLFFIGFDPAVGYALWKSDGTALGTVLASSSVAAMGGFGSVPESMVATDRAVFFTAAEAFDEAGVELWTSDGTDEGTHRVIDLMPGLGSSVPRNLTAVGSTLFFFATTPTGVEQLWKTDGTEAGTVLVKDFEGGGCSSVPTTVAFGRTLLFEANDGANGCELWRSDGTAAGTSMIGEANPGADGAFPQQLTDAGAVAVFVATDPDHGTELWTTDGTAAGLHLVADINPGPGSSQIFGIVRSGALVFFPAFDGQRTELWRSDGTPEGTFAVTDAPPFGTRPWNIAPVGSGVVFVGAGDPSVGGELYFSDGTAGADELVVDLNPGPRDGVASGLYPAGGYVVFVGDDGIHGRELFRTDGTAAGTRLLRDLTTGVGLDPTTPSFGASSAPSSLVALDGRAFFVAHSADGARLYRSDGTSGGTVPVGDVVPEEPEEGQALAVLGAQLVFGGRAPGSAEAGLWASDGIAVTELHHTSAPAPSHGPNAFLPVGDRLLFAATDAEAGDEPWTTDGTPGGTVRLANLVPDDPVPNGSRPELLASNGAFGLFVANGSELWRTDGTAPGTFQLLASAEVGGAAGIGGSIAFVDGRDLWVTDGTVPGTGLLKQFGAPGLGVVPLGLTNIAGTLYFSATDGTSGEEPWRSDGTSAGTSRIADINPGAAGSSPSGFTQWRGEVYFRALHPSSGFELWKTDGTAASTVLVKDCTPGPLSGVPVPLELSAAAGDAHAFVFVGSDGAHGAEPWVSGGTSETTSMLGEIAPGPNSSSPSGLTVVGARVLFAATDERGDRELWSTTLPEVDAAAFGDAGP